MLLKQFGDFNAQHFMNLFPKMAKIARKRLFTKPSLLVYQSNIYHGVEQGIFTQGDKGVLSLRQTSTDLYPGKAMVYFTRGEPG